MIRANIRAGVRWAGVGFFVLANSLFVAAQDVPFDPTVCAPFTDGSALSSACEQMIAAYPTPPNVVPIEVDEATLNQYSFWRVGPDAVTTYDAPSGNVVDQIPAGFNFVRAVDLSVDDWLQIEGGRWLPRSVARYTSASAFHGVQITDGLAYPFAWVLDLSQIYVSAYPGGPRSSQTGRFLERYELVNIFAEATDAEGWNWYMIGPNQWVEQRFVARAEKIERPESTTERWIAVDLYEQTLVAYEGNTPVFATLISSGLEGSETNEGAFTVWARLQRDGMAGATGAPDAYALQSVPYVMYFDDDISLHGTYWHNLFGYRQSHGCVNLSISDAQYIYNWTGQAESNAMGDVETSVYVYSSGEYGVTQSGL